MEIEFSMVLEFMELEYCWVLRGLNVLELQFVMFANHDQNVLVLFRLTQSICFLCKVGIE